MEGPEGATATLTLRKGNDIHTRLLDRKAGTDFEQIFVVNLDPSGVTALDLEIDLNGAIDADDNAVIEVQSTDIALAGNSSCRYESENKK